jgi:1L-myo-inositol 1-phosphate cytidylyltransferase / CDP-L-myo-inositol myo-inositolphosphotransferase
MGSKTATIVIVIAKGSGEVGPDTVVLGLPLLRRIVLMVSRAGCQDILVVNNGSFECGKLLEGTKAVLLPPARLAGYQPSGRILVLTAHLLSHPSLLTHLTEMPLRAEAICVPTGGIAAVETADPKTLLSMIERANDELSLFSELEQTYHRAGTLIDSGRWVRASNRADLPHVERWLLQGLVKDTEGFMSRHVERKISLAVTRRLVGTDITPNQMTGVSVAIGVVGALFFLSSAPAYQLIGALLFLLHSILDGCDGEIARLKYLESRFGGLLDFWGDNAVHTAVFLCIGLGWWMADGALLPLLLACSATVGGLLSAGFVYRQTMRHKTAEGPLFTSITASDVPSRVSVLADALARRDFIYLVVILSAFGKAHWFLILAAIGAPIFFTVVLWNSYREGVQA